MDVGQRHELYISRGVVLSTLAPPTTSTVRHRGRVRACVHYQQLQLLQIKRILIALYDLILILSLVCECHLIGYGPVLVAGVHEGGQQSFVLGGAPAQPADLGLTGPRDDTPGHTVTPHHRRDTTHGAETAHTTISIHAYKYRD